MRTFIAVELEKNLLDEIDNFIFKTYREIDSNKISWVKKENLHITLKFLGEIEEKQVEIIKNILKDISQNVKEFTISIEGLGVFPKMNFPRVIWLGIKDGEVELKTLANLIEDTFSKHGFPKENREFTPHLTIARVKQVKKVEDIINYIEKYKKRTFGISRISNMTFFQSILKPQGPEYKVLGKFGLRTKR